MSVPDYQTFMLPVLKFASQGEVSIKELVSPCAKEFYLTPEERAEELNNGQNKVASRIGWALLYMFKAGLLERPTRGIYRITEEGRKVLAQNLKRINVKFLEQYESFKIFRTRKPKDNSLSASQSIQSNQVPVDEILLDDSFTPDERLTGAFEEVEATLLSDIKEQLSKLSATAFERLVVKMMIGLKYGARGLGQHIGGPGDGGLDGLITEDKLGLDSIYLQAKHYAPDVSVSREKIQAFAGAMDGKSVTKGVFVTTSTFTKQAKEFTDRSPKHIRLVDGDELAQLMIENNIGVRCVRTMEIKRLDHDFFSDLDE